MNTVRPRQYQDDPRERARAEGIAVLGGFRGALSDLSPVERAAIASRCETEQAGSPAEIENVTKA